MNAQPHEIYMDNGPQFRSREKLVKVFLIELKVQVVNSIPGHPHDRGHIERTYDDIRTQLEKTLSYMDGDTPPSIGELRTIDELEDILGKFITRWNKSRSG